MQERNKGAPAIRTWNDDRLGIHAPFEPWDGSSDRLSYFKTHVEQNPKIQMKTSWFVPYNTREKKTHKQTKNTKVYGAPGCCPDRPLENFLMVSLCVFSVLFFMISKHTKIWWGKTPGIWKFVRPPFSLWNADKSECRKSTNSSILYFWITIFIW